MPTIDVTVYRGNSQVATAKQRPVRCMPSNIPGIVYRGKIYPVYREQDGGFFVDLLDPSYPKDGNAFPVARSIPPIPESPRSSRPDLFVETLEEPEIGPSSVKVPSSEDLQRGSGTRRSSTFRLLHDEKPIQKEDRKRETELTITDDQSRSIAVLDRSANREVFVQGSNRIDFFGTLLSLDNVTTRLQNILKNAAKAWKRPASVHDFLVNENGFRTFMLKRPGLGRSTRAELCVSIRDVLRTGNYVRFQDESPNVPARESSRASAESPGNGSREPQEAAATRTRPPEELVDEILAALPERERQVACHRYGLYGCRVETLEALGTARNVTRERIRQIQKRFVRRLQTNPLRDQIVASLVVHKQRIWDQVTNDAVALFRGEIDVAKERIPPETLLLIEMAYGQLEEWLNGVFVNSQLGWFSDNATLDRFTRLSSCLVSRLNQLPVPYPLRRLSRGLDGLSIELCGALITENGWKVYHRYAVSGRMTRRVRRSIDLHSCLQECGEKPVRLPRLLREYRRQFPTDPCSVRDARIVMDMASHLFLPITEDDWLALNRTESSNEHKNPDNDQWREVEDREGGVETPRAADSIASVLAAILNREGPLRFTVLRNKAAEELPPNTAFSSIGVVVLMSGHFRRIAPGLYGLASQSAACAAGEILPSGLFEEDQCRWYAAAKWCGCSLSDFPAWNPTYERALTEWAERQLQDQCTFRSLLAVIAPEKWELSSHTRAYWERKREVEARYELEQDAPALSSYVPELERVIAAAAKAIADGGINWMRINRVIQKRIDFHGAASVLALLSLVGVVRPPLHWQRWHSVSPAAEQVMGDVLTDLESNGEVSWSGESGRRLIDVGRTRSGQGGLGWLTETERVSLTQAIEGYKKGASKRGDDEDTESIDPLAQARIHARRRRALERAKAIRGDDERD